MRFRTICFAALAALLLAGPACPAVILTLDPPGGAISGQPGQTAGWGYTLATDESIFLIVEGFEFGEITPKGTFYPAGFAPRWQAASSVSPLVVPFDASVGDGIGYLVGAFAPGSKAEGLLSVIYQTWDLDPVTDPAATMLFSGLRVDATDAAGDKVNASVTVLKGEVVIPEPATWTLVACAVALALLRRRRG